MSFLRAAGIGLVLAACAQGGACRSATSMAARAGEIRTAAGLEAEEGQVKLGEKQTDPKEERKAAIERARQHLAKTEKLKPEEVSVESAEPATWPDASLGCPEKDRMYAQVVTEGHKVVLRVRGSTRELHVSRTRVVECKDPASRGPQSSGPTTQTAGPTI